MFKLTRRFFDDGWILRTDGHGGVLAPAKPEEIPNPLPPPREGKGAMPTGTIEVAPARAAETMRWWRHAVLDRAIDAEALREFVDPEACSGCGDRRMKFCHNCNATGVATAECDGCNHQHECVCPECDEGYIACRLCMQDAPLIVCGLPINRPRLRAIVAEAAFGAGPILVGAVSEGSEKSALLLAQGDVRAGVMPMVFDDGPIAKARSWPNGMALEAAWTYAAFQRARELRR